MSSWALSKQSRNDLLGSQSKAGNAGIGTRKLLNEYEMAHRAQRLGIDLHIPALYEEIGKTGASKLCLAAKELRISLSQAKAR